MHHISWMNATLAALCSLRSPYVRSSSLPLPVCSRKLALPASDGLIFMAKRSTRNSTSQNLTNELVCECVSECVCVITA